MDPDEEAGSNVGPEPAPRPLTLTEFRRGYAAIHLELGIEMPDALI